jgi:hypothetical protein
VEAAAGAVDLGDVATALDCKGCFTNYYLHKMDDFLSKFEL